MELLQNIFISLRPKQWLKNCFVFVALIFSRNFFEWELVMTTLLAFALFCIVSSSVYLMNDVVDYPYDKKHPEKKNRPIAADKVSRKLASVLAIIFSLGAFYLAFILNVYFGILLIGYFLLNVLYSFGFKKVVALDVILIAVGFVLRAIGGGLVIDVEVSSWLVVCTFLLTLFMALSKRRQEILVMEKNGGEITRAVLGKYNKILVDQMMNIVTPSALIAYIFYTFSEGHNKDMMVTIPMVLYGLFRYLYLIYQKRQGEDPAAILYQDRPLQVTALLWMGSMLLILIYVK